jgi:hypothetical protein
VVRPRDGGRLLAYIPGQPGSASDKGLGDKLPPCLPTNAAEISAAPAPNALSKDPGRRIGQAMVHPLATDRERPSKGRRARPLGSQDTRAMEEADEQH